jgi:hypothetical protein
MEEKLKQLKKEFGDKFYSGLYPCVNGASEATEIWEWVTNNFVTLGAEVRRQIAEVIKIIDEEWRIVDSYDKTTPKDQYYKDREFAEYAKLVLETLKDKIVSNLST